MNFSLEAVTVNLCILYVQFCPVLHKKLRCCFIGSIFKISSAVEYFTPGVMTATGLFP